MLHHSLMVKENPSKPAIISETGEVMSYLEFHHKVSQVSHYFNKVGLKAKDNISILMDNSAIFPVFIIAALDCGLIVTTVSTHLKQSEVEYIVNNSDSKFIVVSEQYADVARAIVKSTPKIESRMIVGAEIPDHKSFDESVALMPSEPIEYGVAGGFMLYSSGTTGLPKGITYVADERQVLDPDPAFSMMAQALGFNSETTYLSTQPLYHSAPAGILLTALVMGGTVVLINKFDEQKALSLIERYRVTHSMWVPTMFVRMLKLPEEVRSQYDVSSQKVVLHSAAPCPIKVKERMIEWWGKNIVEFWGGTEISMVTVINSDQWLEHKGSVGTSVVGKLHILDEDGEELPPNEIGKIYVEGIRKFEYHKEKEKTSASRNQSGWCSIGDKGYLDEDGFLYLTGRESHMIISGGVNIYPEETESLLINHAKVMDVAVLGAPNEEFGEEVKAVVQLVNPSDASAELASELIAFCKNEMSAIKCPRTIDFTEKLPRTPSGKLIKTDLRKLYWECEGSNA